MSDSTVAKLVSPLIEELQNYEVKWSRTSLIAQGVATEFEVFVAQRRFNKINTFTLGTHEKLYELALELRKLYTTMESEWILSGNPAGFHNFRFPWYSLKVETPHGKKKPLEKLVDFDFKREPFPFGKRISYEAAFIEVLDNEVPLELLPKWLLKRLELSPIHDTIEL